MAKNAKPPPDASEIFPWPGIHSPAYTQVPDEVLDVLTPYLSGAELKVLLYIIRRTFGWKKDMDAISIDQMTNGITTTTGRRLDLGTGLSRRHVLRALKSLQEKEVILAIRQVGRDGRNLPTAYGLKMRGEAMSQGGGQKVTKGSDKRSPRRVTGSSPSGGATKSPPQEEDINIEKQRTRRYIDDLLQEMKEGET